MWEFLLFSSLEFVYIKMCQNVYYPTSVRAHIIIIHNKTQRRHIRGNERKKKGISFSIKHVRKFDINNRSSYNKIRSRVVYHHHHHHFLCQNRQTHTLLSLFTSRLTFVRLFLPKKCVYQYMGHKIGATYESNCVSFADKHSHTDIDKQKTWERSRNIKKSNIQTDTHKIITEFTVTFI